MTKIQSENNPHRSSISARSIILGILALLVISILASSVFGLMSKYFDIRGHIKELKQQEVELQQKQKDLAAMNSYIATPEGQERVFRDKYRLIKPGEGMIVITDNQQKEKVVKKPAISRFFDSIMKGLGLR